MTTQIRRADFADYASYIDAIAEPIGGGINPIVWDEAEQVFVLNPEWVAEQKGRGRRVRPDSTPTA